MIRKVCAVLILVVLVLCITPGFVSADSSDARAALMQLQNLDNSSKGLLLRNFWDQIIVKIGEGLTVDADPVYNTIKANLTDAGVWNNIVLETGTVPGDGRIAASSIRTLTQKIINNNQVIVEFYDLYEDTLTKAWVKDFLNLPQTATPGEVYEALLPYTVEILILDGAEFVRYGNVSAKMASKLGVDQSLFSVILGDINGRVDQLAAKINNNMQAYGVSQEDMIYALEIYNLYGDPDSVLPFVSSTDPVNNAASVPVNKSVTVVFNENIWAGNSFSEVKVENPSGSIINTTSVILNSKLTIIPLGNLDNNIVYKVTIPSNAVEDKAGNSMSTSYVFKFTTASAGGDGGNPGGGGTPGGDVGPGSGGSSGGPQEEQDIEDSLEEISNNLNELGSGLETGNGTSEQQQAADSITEELIQADTLLDNISNPDEMFEKAVLIIEDAVEALNSIDTDSISIGDAVQAIKDIATRVLERFNTKDVVPVVSGASATAELSLETGSDGKLLDGEGKLSDKSLQEQLEKIVDTAKRLNSKLGDDTGRGMVTAVFNINAVAGTGAAESSVTIPAPFVTAAKNAGIAGIKIQTNVASVSIPIDALSLNREESIVLKTIKVDNEKLPEEIKNVVQDSQVFDFSLWQGNKKINKFNSNLEVAVPYILKPSDDHRKITVFYINDNGELENVVGSYDEATGTVIFTVDHFSNYIIRMNKVAFSDLGSVGWAKDYIEVMASKGIVGGIGNGLFKPSANITRAEFIAMIVRGFKLQENTAQNTFRDVNEKDWYYQYVTSAAKHGIISGGPGGTFAPTENITREDMAVIISNSIALMRGRKSTVNIDKNLAGFKDRSKISKYAAESVALAVKNSIITGKPGGLFEPKELLTRAEAAAVFYRLFYLKM